MKSLVVSIYKNKWFYHFFFIHTSIKRKIIVVQNFLISWKKKKKMKLVRLVYTCEIYWEWQDVDQRFANRKTDSVNALKIEIPDRKIKRIAVVISKKFFRHIRTAIDIFKNVQYYRSIEFLSFQLVYRPAAGNSLLTLLILSYHMVMFRFTY